MIALGRAYRHVFVSLLILGVLCTVFSPALGKQARRMYPVYVKLNSSYAVLIDVQGTPLSFMKGNESIRQGSSSDPCIAGDPCWELLNDRSYARLQSENVSGNGTIIVTPIDRKKSSTKILVRDQNGTSRGLPTPKGDCQTPVLEVDPKTNSVTCILYDEKVQKTNVSGNIQIIDDIKGPSGERWLMVPYLSKFYEGKYVVLLTGYIGNSGEIFQGKLAGNGTIQVYLMEDPNAPDYKTLRVSFRSACADNPWNIMVYVLTLIVIKANA